MIEFARHSRLRGGGGGEEEVEEDRAATLEALLAYYLHRSRFAEAHQLVKHKAKGGQRDESSVIIIGWKRRRWKK